MTRVVNTSLLITEANHERVDVGELLANSPEEEKVVDDEAVNRQVLVNHLTRKGYEVVEAHSGEQALTLLETSFDLVLLDVMMPGMNGFDVLREMRSFSDTPTLMLTARGEEIDRIVGLESDLLLEAVEELVAAAGTSANFTSSPLALIRNDVRAVAAHYMVAPYQMDAAGRVLLGLEPTEFGF